MQELISNKNKTIGEIIFLISSNEVIRHNCETRNWKQTDNQLNHKSDKIMSRNQRKNLILIKK